MIDKDFIEIIYEIAFGDNAINKDYTKEEVVARIQEYSDLSLEYEEKQNGDYYNDRD